MLMMGMSLKLARSTLEVDDGNEPKMGEIDKHGNGAKSNKFDNVG